MSTATRSDLQEAFVAFLHASRRARAGAARAPELRELTLAQFQVLEAVAVAGCGGNHRVAETAEISQPTVCRTLDLLERRGLVTRSRRDDDRRAVAVALTPRGQQLLDRKRAFIEERLARIEASLDADERERAAEVLRRLAEVMDSL